MSDDLFDPSKPFSMTSPSGYVELVVHPWPGEYINTDQVLGEIEDLGQVLIDLAMKMRKQIKAEQN